MAIRFTRPRARTLVAAAVGIVLGGCAVALGPVLSVSAPDRTWLSLPIQGWVLRDGLSSHAAAICRPPQCERPGALIVFTARGQERRALETTFADPRSLATVLLAEEEEAFTRRAELEQMARARGITIPPETGARGRLAVDVERLTEGNYDGFRIRMARRDGARPPAFGAVLAARESDAITVAIVISDDPDAARRDARRALSQVR